MSVAELLAHKGGAIFTIKPNETIAALSQLLREKRIGAAVVSLDGATVEGVISERDIAYGLATHKDALHQLPVSALMTKAVICCSPQDTVGFVASTMMSRNIRHVPVADNDRFVGMVSMRDVLNWRLVELQQQTAQLRSFVAQTSTPPQDRE